MHHTTQTAQTDVNALASLEPVREEQHGTALSNGSIAQAAEERFPVAREYGQVVLRACAQHLLDGELDAGRALIQRVLKAGADRRDAARLLLGVAYTSLGRASILADRPEPALRQLASGKNLGVPGGVAVFKDLLVAEADRLGREGSTREAVQRWQDIATLLGEKTPESIYQNLSEAYARNHEGFGGSREENRCWGDCHKHDVLSFLHEVLEPRLYFEIGVDEGRSLVRARGAAIGIDPRPKLKLGVQLMPQARIIAQSSDAFFRDQPATLLQPKPDLVFIDGMHLFEFALRDFINVERHANPATLVAIDDIFPCHPTQATRRRRSKAWTGDIWKLNQILREERPDLTLIALNAHTTGLLLIAGLDPDNKVLCERYDQIVRRYSKERPPGPEILARHGAIPSSHPLLKKVLQQLQMAREGSWHVNRVRDALDGLFAQIRDVEQEYMNRAESLEGKCELKLRET